MFKIISFFSLCFIGQPFVQAATCDTLESLTWLVGNWHTENKKLQINESWRRVSTKTLEGDGNIYSTTKNKLISAETLLLVEMSGAVFYVAKVASNDLPVAFKLTSCSEKTATFVNLQHDFPNKISYQFNNEQSMTVVVSGNNGKGFNVELIRQTIVDKQLNAD
ncbi:MAG: hypothetical protein HRU22_08575 [Gammaproteobacteria bacterium]|nr:hypothetical protein [Gammaproteobacteria bacterium]